MDAAPARLLLVDDDARYLASLAALLGAKHFDVDTADRIDVALDKLDHADYDVVVLDLNLPGGHGIDLVQVLAKDERNIKSIVVTSDASPEAIAPVLRAGVNDYLLKPLHQPQLLASIDNLLERKRLEDDNRRMHARIEASDQLHRYLVNQSPDVIYMLDHNGKFTYVNSKVIDVFGCEKAELLDQHWTVLFAEDDRDRAAFVFNERRLGERATRHVELRARSPRGGEPIYLEITSMGIWRTGVAGERAFFGTYGVARNVTQRRSTELKLSESQRKFFTLFESSPDAIFISRLDTGELLDTNAGFRSIAGNANVAGSSASGASSSASGASSSASGASGSASGASSSASGASSSANGTSGNANGATSAAAPSTDAFLWRNVAHRTAFANGLMRTPTRYRQEITLGRGQATQQFELAARHIVVEQADCMLGTLRDLTLQKSGERERIALEQQLQQARKLEAIGQLAGGIAHDFNNILASMIGYAELAMQPTEKITDDKRRGYLEQVITAGERARDLIAQLLSFSRTSQEHAGHVDLGNELAQTTRMLRAAIPTTIDIECGPVNTPVNAPVNTLGNSSPSSNGGASTEAAIPAVLIDPVHLQQVVINLMVNARDAIDGVGRIDIAPFAGITVGECSSCHARFDGSWVGFTVSDTGRGIAEGMLPRIFDRFVTSREAGQGSGIGLAVVHSIVHEYGGHLTVDSEPGNGTRFRILFPPSQQDEGMRAPAHLPGASYEEARGRVLVVDDEASVGNMIAESLRSAGFEVMLFSDAADAWETIRTDPDQLDLIVTDQTMPRMSGIELTEKVKALPRNIPVVLVTGYEDRARADAAGVDYVLKKPFSVATLLGVAREMTVGADLFDDGDVLDSWVAASDTTELLTSDGGRSD